MFDDKLLEKKSRWKHVSELPDFPVQDFQSLTSGIGSRKYSVVLDKALVGQLAVIFGGRLGSLAYMMIRMLMICVAVGLIFAVRAGYLFALWGVLLSIVVLLVSSRLRWLTGAVVLLSPLAIAATILTKHTMLASLVVGLLLPLMLLWLTNRTNRWLVKKAALDSESTFLYMYERGVVALKDNTTKKVYWCLDSASGNEFC